MRFAQLASLGIAMVGLTGCYRIHAGNLKLKPEDACGPAFAEFKCAPTAGPSLALSKYQTAVPIVNGNPRWDDFVGRVNRTDDRRGGAPDRNCVADNMFDPTTDFDFDVFQQRVQYEQTITTELTTSLTANLVEAARLAGATGATLNKVEARIKSAFKSNSVRKLKGTVRFRTAQLKPGVVRSLNDAGSRFATCAAFLSQHPELRLVRAVSGFHVDSATVNSESAQNFEATLKAALSGLSAAQVAALDVAIKSAAATTFSTVMSPTFLVVSVTFVDRQPR